MATSFLGIEIFWLEPGLSQITYLFPTNSVIWSKSANPFGSLLIIRVFPTEEGMGESPDQPKNCSFPPHPWKNSFSVNSHYHQIFIPLSFLQGWHAPFWGNLPPFLGTPSFWNKFKKLPPLSDSHPN